jgi:hypothetical protein
MVGTITVPHKHTGIFLKMDTTGYLVPLAAGAAAATMTMTTTTTTTTTTTQSTHQNQ